MEAGYPVVAPAVVRVVCRQDVFVRDMRQDLTKNLQWRSEIQR